MCCRRPESAARPWKRIRTNWVIVPGAGRGRRAKPQGRPTPLLTLLPSHGERKNVLPPWPSGIAWENTELVARSKMRVPGSGKNVIIRLSATALRPPHHSTPLSRLPGLQMGHKAMYLLNYDSDIYFIYFVS